MFKSIAIVAGFAALAAAAPASADIKWNGLTTNGISLQGKMLNGISLQGKMFNGVQLNGPGLVLQGRLLNGVQFNGPGIVFQGTMPNGARLLDHDAAPVRERIDLTLAVHTVTLASGEVVAVD